MINDTSMGIGHYMAKEVMREIGNKSREFYEFVLPPVDMILQNDSLVVSITYYQLVQQERTMLKVP
jgi:hypothetical protein